MQSYHGSSVGKREPLRSWSALWCKGVRQRRACLLTQLPHRIIGKMSIALCGLRLRVPKLTADDGQGTTSGDRVAGPGMAQVVDAYLVEARKGTNGGP